MARTIQQGMLYFNIDVDFFQDIKIRRILRACGPQSIPILIWLLSSIFRDEGYYVRWCEDMPFLISDDIGVTDGAVWETVKKSLQVGFFDADMYEKYSILTSHGIQTRFFEMARRRVYVNCDKKYVLVDTSTYKNVINVDDNFKNVDSNKINVDSNAKNVCHNQQSKVKESKVKESKVEEVKEENISDFSKLVKIYQNNIHPISSPIEQDKLSSLLDDFGLDIVSKAIERSVSRGKRNIGYITAILNNWQENGYDEEKSHVEKKQTASDRRKADRERRRARAMEIDSHGSRECNRVAPKRLSE